ncbi:unnamed protein product [Caenorhabditis brenneri]
MSEPASWHIAIQNEHIFLVLIKVFLGLIKEFFSLDCLMLLIFVLGPLTLCFLCCLPYYLRAYRRNREAHEMSPLAPLAHLSYRIIKIIYPLFFIALFAVIVLSVQQKSLTVEKIKIFIELGLIVAIVRDFTCGVCMFLEYIKHESLTMPYFHYAFLEAPLLITLLIGFVFQVFTKSTNSTSHSEKVIAAQIKIIGAVKLLLLIATVTCYFLGTQTSAAIKLFFLIDLLLVPVAIELTEIRFNPNVINFSDNVLVPHEVKKEPFEI